MRAGNLMWMLGAGASASAGIPTAWDMIWEFKQKLFVSQRKVSPRSVADLGNAAVRAQLQSHLDASGTLPPPGAPEEYAALFEAAWPNEGDRRTYIDGKITGAKPSYGHFALATLMRAGITKLIWTTNFDTLVADACAKVYDSTGALTSVALDAPALATEVIGMQRWPIEIKLHGDFRSRRLKNTGDELRQQDAELRRLLVQSCGSAGLIIAGYSGRDDSIMDTLVDAVTLPNAFPAGLFWLHRGDAPPLPRVEALLHLAADRKVDGGVVAIENFDETLRDLVRLSDGLDTTTLEKFAENRSRWTPASRPMGRTTYPIVRLNALSFEAAPTICRRVVCEIGGYSEVDAAVEEAGVDILTARTKAGVLAFGADDDVRKAFTPYGIREFDLYSIQSHRLRYDSGERGLLRQAISRALSRSHGMELIRHRATDLLFPSVPEDPKWAPLRTLVRQLHGAVRGHPELTWYEGIGLKLEWAADKVWLVFEPRTIFEGMDSANRHAASDFARERTVRRYNRALNDLIHFWARKLSCDGEEHRALGISDGVDATFRLSSVTAFSRRIGA
jgi:hypothetical protein